jgi:hypothetical protein
MLEWLFKKRRKEQPMLVDPSTILFSLATICDALPECSAEGQLPDRDSLVLHEDDWRQVEFVCKEDRSYLDGLLEEIRRFRSENWTGSGFKSVYVRKEHPTQLSERKIPVGELLSVPGCDGLFGRLYINFIDVSQIENGFALRTNLVDAIYGISPSNKISALALQWKGKDSEVIARLAPFCSTHGLLLVDWYQAKALV